MVVIGRDSVIVGWMLMEADVKVKVIRAASEITVAVPIVGRVKPQAGSADRNYENQARA